jgi:hypothetical protein
MAPEAADRLFTAQFARLATTDSIPLANDSWLEVAPIALLLARAIRELSGENSA